jgi:predicted acyltransferase
LLGTISGVAHVLIGFYCGKLIKQKETIGEKALAVFAVGTVCVIAGYLLTYGLPLNKRIWSPSYVLVTCGLAALLQALLIKREAKAPLSSPGGDKAPLSSPEGDTNAGKPGNEAPSGAVGGAGALGRAFVVFGVNALALYVASELLAILFGHFGVSEIIYNALHSIIIWDKWASLAYALTFVVINYALGYVLWKRKIFIKL